VRLDKDYLLARGAGGAGVTTSLGEKRVVLIGCGAVGSRVAQHVAGLGVGTLDLVDKEELQSANVQRHALGVESIGRNKAEALADALSHHFPHQRFGARSSSVQLVLQDEPAFIAEADLVLIALGEPALERWLNQALCTHGPRIHAWLEPLGVGGHVLLTGVARTPGCYECLFENDDAHGLRNRADLVAPGQDMNQTLAGCAGTFSPFSALDAARTAVEAANACGRALAGEEHENLLVTWRGEIGAFERSGYRLSVRGERIQPGARLRHGEFGRLDCPACGEGK
jgi:molybdopterin/thiamine biosynthesis adenylyltransferase